MTRKPLPRFWTRTAGCARATWRSLMRTGPSASLGRRMKSSCAAVVGVPDLILGELTCACIVLEERAKLSAQEALAFAEARLPDYARPDRALFFDVLPRHAGGPRR